MQPSPIGVTSKLLFSSFRFCIVSNAEGESALSYQPSTSSSLRFKRCHVDREPVLHIGLEQSLVRFVHFLDRDNFDIGGDVMFATKVEHLLGFGDAADHRAGETATPADETERRNRERLCGSADQRKIAVDAE